MYFSFLKMKRIKIQQGYLAKRQPKRVKYYDQGLPTNSVLPSRELLMHKSKEEQDLGRLMTYISALQGLDKPKDKSWYQKLFSRKKNAEERETFWKLYKDYLFKRGRWADHDDASDDDDDGVDEEDEIMKQERERRFKNALEDLEKSKVKKEIDEILLNIRNRDLQNQRDREELDLMEELEREKHRTEQMKTLKILHKRTNPLNHVHMKRPDVPEVRDDSDNEPEDIEDLSSVESLEPSSSSNSPEKQTVVLPNGTKAYIPDDVIDLSSAVELPSYDDMREEGLSLIDAAKQYPTSNIPVSPLYSLDKSLVVYRNPNGSPVVLKGANAGTTATPLSSGQQKEVAHSNILAKSLQVEYDAQKQDDLREQMNTALTQGSANARDTQEEDDGYRGRVGVNILQGAKKGYTQEQLDSFVKHPRAFLTYLVHDLPHSLLNILKTAVKDGQFSPTLSRMIDDRVNAFGFVVQDVLPYFVQNVDPNIRSDTLLRLSRKAANNINKFLDMVTGSFENIEDAPDYSDYIHDINQLFNDRVLPELIKRNKKEVNE